MPALAARPVAVATPAPWRAWLPACVIVAAALVQQALVTPLDGDVSWLLTVGERVLDGARLYRDVWEVNPPASVLLYLPGIVLARAGGFSPEAATVALAFAVAVAAAVAAARIGRERSPGIAAATAFALLVLPGGCFAQREHFALLFAFPAVAALARAAEDGEAPWWTGIGAGLTVAIKPHFALALAPLALVAWYRRGSLHPVAGGLATAGVVVLAYALAVVTVWPDYPTDVVPLLRMTYLPLHERWDRLLLGPIVSLPLALGGLAVWLLASPAPAGGESHLRDGDPLAPFCLIAMTGFALAALIQGKGYANHALPGAALGLVAVALAARGADPGRRVLALGGAALLALLQWHAFSGVAPRPGLAAAIVRAAPPHPSIAALSIDLDVGHPVTRLVGGTWIGRRAALFVWGGARWRGDPALDRYARADVAVWAGDVACGRPDVILVDDAPGSAALRREPPVRRVLAGYRPAARAGEVGVWTRITPPSPAHSPACPG